MGQSEQFNICIFETWVHTSVERRIDRSAPSPSSPREGPNTCTAGRSPKNSGEHMYESKGQQPQSHGTFLQLKATEMAAAAVIVTVAAAPIATAAAAAAAPATAGSGRRQEEHASCSCDYDYLPDAARLPTEPLSPTNPPGPTGLD
eukprot:GHVU01142563.1.p2 GENE.GHVU01142563.1~~GHVU01142563.1.p2  ORF type:complete len:146 (-),score=21.89 GHVU01142563.1:346-783(-)